MREVQREEVRCELRAGGIADVKGIEIERGEFGEVAGAENVVRERTAVKASGNWQAETLNQTDEQLRIADERHDDRVWRRQFIIAAIFRVRGSDQAFVGFAVAHFDVFSDEAVASAVAEDAVEAFVAHEQVVAVATGDGIVVRSGVGPALDWRADRNAKWNLLGLGSGSRIVNAQVICARWQRAEVDGRFAATNHDAVLADQIAKDAVGGARSDFQTGAALLTGGCHEQVDSFEVSGWVVVLDAQREAGLAIAQRGENGGGDVERVFTALAWQQRVREDTTGGGCACGVAGGDAIIAFAGKDTDLHRNGRRLNHVEPGCAVFGAIGDPHLAAALEEERAVASFELRRRDIDFGDAFRRGGAVINPEPASGAVIGGEEEFRADDSEFGRVRANRTGADVSNLVHGRSVAEIKLTAKGAGFGSKKDASGACDEVRRRGAGDQAGTRVRHFIGFEMTADQNRRAEEIDVIVDDAPGDVGAGDGGVVRQADVEDGGVVRRVERGGPEFAADLEGRICIERGARRRVFGGEIDAAI